MTTNEEIAELLGWTPTVEHTRFGGTYLRYISPDGSTRHDWLHSLDLVHDDLESVLDTDEQHKYLIKLSNLVDPSGDYELGEVGMYWRLINASAAVKCQAFVSVMRNRKDR
jgi:hypothetical protein